MSRQHILPFHRTPRLQAPDLSTPLSARRSSDGMRVRRMCRRVSEAFGRALELITFGILLEIGASAAVA